VRLAGKPGDPTGFSKDPKEIAAFIKKQPGYKEGMPVKLAACSAGAGSDSIASKLSTEMGVPVTAPDKTLFVYKDGSSVVADDFKDPSTNGKWVTFGSK
jgi:hypothetical protein